MTIDPTRRALITGGASGFGLAIARALTEAGASVALLDRDADGAARASAELGGKAVAVPADVRTPTEVQDAVGAAVEALGGLDTVVVSAGVIRFNGLDDVSEDEWDLVVDVNLKGAFFTCQAAAPALRASGKGRIVTISSDAGRRGAPRIQAYTAAKFGLVGLTESLAAELAADGITANCVCPVACPTTPMGGQVLDWKSRERGWEANEIAAAAAAANPLGRNATEHDVTAAVLFFIADETSFLTGVALDVDGGLHLAALPGMR
jgi:meso-butanediol dehydrogenase / (S,S)-butanediol dehydrogenase / diacetyl reductase